MALLAALTSLTHATHVFTHRLLRPVVADLMGVDHVEDVAIASPLAQASSKVDQQIDLLIDKAHLAPADQNLTHYSVVRLVKIPGEIAFPQVDGRARTAMLLVVRRVTDSTREVKVS